jgi:hypothetical protein
MKNYFLSKLFDINYRMAIHEGNANQRLASQSVKILFQLHSNEVPDKYKKDFDELKILINRTLEVLPQPGLIPIRIKGIKNSTATKYIKLLFDIREYLEN